MREDEMVQKNQDRYHSFLFSSVFAWRFQWFYSLVKTQVRVMDEVVIWQVLWNNGYAACIQVNTTARENISRMWLYGC